MDTDNVSLPISEYYELHRLAEGVFAAIATPGSAAYSNAGMIDLGDQTLVFDAFESINAAQDLHAASIRLTGRRPDWLIISHGHPDHWMGAQVFADHAAILSTHETRTMMLEFADEILEDKSDPSGLYENLKDYQERLSAEGDHDQRAALEIAIARQRHEIEMLSSLDLTFPTHTFEGHLVFHGSRRNAELLTHGKGHTSSDCYLVLPDEKIAFIGDLGFFGCQPYMPYGDSQAWMHQLELLQASDFEIFVPGHGPLGGKTDLSLECEYIALLEEAVARIVRQGGSLQDTLQITLPDRFGAWVRMGQARFEANVQSIFERLTAE
jgi:cyclase